MDWGRFEGSRRRSAGRRATVVLVFVSVVALWAAGARSARAASPADNRVVTVSYQGTYHGTINYDEADLGTIVSDVSWDFEWTGTLAQLFAPADKVFTVNALTATETVSQHGTTCTASFSENPATGNQTPVGRLLTGVPQPTDKVLIGVQAPIGLEDLISNDPACAGNGVEGAGADGQQQTQLEVPRPLFDLEMLGPQSQPFDGSWSSSDTISTSTSKFESTVTFGGGPPARTPAAVRAWARQEWNDMVPIYRAVIVANSRLLLPLRISEILSDLEIPITGLRSLDKQLREFISGGAFVKLFLLPLMTDTYSTMLKTLTDLERAFNDPPLGNYRRVAAVPRAKPARFESCGVAPAGARPFCRRYVSAGTAWLAALSGTEGLSRALATDVGRESAAAKANDTAALVLLQAAELAILPNLKAAEVKQRAAGKRLAGVLRSARFDPRATSTRAHAGIEKLLADLAKRGVSAADVSSILGGREISPKPLDLLSLISR